MPYKSCRELSFTLSRLNGLVCRAVFLLLTTTLFSAMSQAASLTIYVTDKKGAPVENAVVYLEAFDDKEIADVSNLATAAPTIIEQKNKQFIPLVSVARVGSSIAFPNRDSVRHHVYSFSPAKTFELKLYSGVPATPVLFDKPGTAVLGCNIHDKMVAFVHIVDTPYFAKTDSTGKAMIDLPNKPYVLKVWHYALLNENKVFEKKINIDNTDMQEAITIELKPFLLPK